MRPIRTILFATCVIMTLGAFAPAALAASTPSEFHLTKDCGSFTGVKPSFCTITVSNIEAVPAGSKIWYTGPVLTNAYFLSSNVTLETKEGSKASGYCMFQGKTSMGLCTFWKGTGKLIGFTSVVDVSIDSAGLWHFDGMYYFAEAPVPPATSTDGRPGLRHRTAPTRPF